MCLSWQTIGLVEKTCLQRNQNEERTKCSRLCLCVCSSLPEIRIMSWDGQTRGYEECLCFLRNKTLLNLNKFSSFLQTLYNLKWRHWPTFLQGLTCSTVAVRRRSSQGGGRTPLSQRSPNAPWRERPGDRANRSSYSDWFFTIRGYRVQDEPTSVVKPGRSNCMFDWTVLLFSPFL